MSPFGWTKTLWWRSIAVTVVLACATVAGGQTIDVKVIGNDRGGLIGARAIEVAELNTHHRRVELRGRVCYSSCTLYLGAQDLCISPQTVFGFHGPSRYGAPLDAGQFEHWSGVMARHYIPPLRNWFLDTARHRINQISRISGAQLIALGYPAC